MAKQNRWHSAILVPALLGSMALHAQGNSAAMATPDFKTQDPCRAEVSKFEQAIGFVRQTQGAKAAAELKEKLLPAKTENEILFKDGYCGIAKYLKEKKLNR